MTRVVLVPGCLALLPEYASLADPVSELRAACLSAVGWLGEAVTVVADPQGRKIADHLLVARTSAGPPSADEGASYLVVGNGSARRTEKAPGAFDERAEAFDAHLGAALRTADAGALRSIDPALAAELWAGVGEFGRLADLAEGLSCLGVDYDDLPYGVQYWVVRWA